MPATDHNEADDLPAFLRIGSNHGCIDLGDELEYRLDSLVRQGCLTVLDLTELRIRKHDLQNGIEDVAFAIHFLLNHLIDSQHFCKLMLPHGVQGESQYTWELI